MTLLSLVITYGAKTWPLQKVDYIKLVVLEKNVLRKIYLLASKGSTVKGINSHELKIGTNNELESIVHRPNILETIKSKRLQ